ncbi:hypothetical protein H0X06_04860 [Candidatus Dependentiae bacterium]|nr:hypothetical protein [Candidatus Dependentiae bacterium]
MNKRFLYNVFVVSQIVAALPLYGQRLKLGFKEIGISAVGCAGNNGVLRVIPQSSVSTPNEITYTLNPGQNEIVNTTGIFQSLIPGTYTLEIFDPRTDEDRDAQVVVTQLIPLVIANVAITNVRVAGQATGSVTVTLEGGRGDIFFILNNEERQRVDNFQVTIPNLRAGDYTLVFSSEDGCPPIRMEFSIIEPDA